VGAHHILLLIGVSVFTMVKVQPGHRAFNYMIAALLATASVAYFSMASDLGATPITVEFLHGNWAQSGDGRFGYPTRSIWYARYIDWTITTPLLLLTLLLITPVPTSTVFITIFMDIVMIVTGLIGSLVQSRYKWGFWTMGMFAMFWVFAELCVSSVLEHPGAWQHASTKSRDLKLMKLRFFLLQLRNWSQSSQGHRRQGSLQVLPPQRHRSLLPLVPLPHCLVRKKRFRDEY